MDLKILSQIHSPHSLFELRAVAEHPESMGIARNQSDAATALRMSEIALSDTNEAVAEWKRLPSSRQIRAELAFVDRQEERLRSTNQGIKREGWVVDAGADVTQLDTLALAGHKAPSLQPPMLCYFMHVDPNGKIALATKFFHSGVAQFQPMICAQLEYYEQARRLIRQGYYVLK